MLKLTTLLLIVTTIVYGQGDREGIVVKRTSKEYKRHFSPPPENIETAMSQIDSDFTESGRNYFRQLPEKIAVLQFGEEFHYLQFTWKMSRQNPTRYSIRKNSALVDYFISNGAGGHFDETIRLITIGLHRQHNNKPFTISELYKSYGDKPFKMLRDSIRDVNPRDTVFGSWFNRDKFFSPFTYSAWFEVLSKDNATDMLQVKILRIQLGQSDVAQIKFGETTWKIGDVITVRNKEMRNWKEVIRYDY